mgnify:CR=1 FL=1|jgi:TrmH family RNA methyltransferase
MITKAQIKLVQSLRNSSDREREGLYVVEGVKLVEELIHSSHKVNKVFATVNWKQPEDYSGDIILIQDWELEKISSLTTPNKVLALAEIPQSTNQFSNDVNHELVLLLDRISDPGNMGTIIRTAEWFGIDRIIASEDSVDFYNSKVVQASMGSIFRMRLNKLPLLTTLEKLSNLMPVYGTLFDGEILGRTTLSPEGIIIIGNESHGISEVVKRFVNRKITIPDALTSNSESLNASVATAIVCFEFRRQFPKQ